MANKKTRKLMGKITEQYARDMDRTLDTSLEEGFFASSMGDDGHVCSAMKGSTVTVLKLLTMGIIKVVELSENDESKRDAMIESVCDMISNAYARSRVKITAEE